MVSVTAVLRTGTHVRMSWGSAALLCQGTTEPGNGAHDCGFDSRTALILIALLQCCMSVSMAGMASS